jgi:uncharacterized protein YjiS (DUF1127 family)
MSMIVDHSVYRSPYHESKGLGGLLTGLRLTLRRWRQRSHERRQLAMMNRAQLKDIGLTLSDVRREVNKPCWRR